MLGGCGYFASKFRFRMTVEVETPQGLRTASGVMEVKCYRSPVAFLPDAHKLEIEFRGEAVSVDLPRSTLFALIGNTPKAWPFEIAVIDTFDPSGPRGEKLVKLIHELSRSPGRSAAMQPTNFPKLVRFRDMHDPKTVELVDPANFAKAFGPGLTLKRIVLTVVDEPVTNGIEKRLAWLGPYPEPRLSPNYSEITHGDFKSWRMEK